MTSSTAEPESPSSAEPPRQISLVRVRMLAALTGLIVLVGVGVFNGWPDAAVPVAVLLVLLLLSNLPLRHWFGREQSPSHTLIASVLVFDIALLTAMLSLTGGSSNPFSSAYLLYVTVAALLLPPGWTSSVVAAAVVAYGGLYWVDSQSPHHGHHSMQLHLLGMWMAFVVVGPVLAYAITRLRNEAEAAEAELRDARQRQERAEKLSALATLSAGAAHELATPLATIAVIAKDLERREGDPELAEDASMIREEIDRCSGILSQLALDVGSGIGEASREIRLGDLADELVAAHAGIALDADDEVLERGIILPRRLSSQAFDTLLSNARHASRPDDEIALRMRFDADTLVVEVEDHGEGMSGEVQQRALEPFFTTKPTGEGMGLGLFFADSVVAHLGGSLEIDSEPTRGTRVEVRIPPQAPIHEAEADV